ncbi:zinc finger protein 708-like [Dendronephthya gigantea]|uniref:zinc finger protein 708-like n=1 Tax=Dendronephthya gigantea TaxID=151771 RepID=UPI00106D1E7F|nr:zinc finger protein 708-like [Dendronephthya gigantea]
MKHILKRHLISHRQKKKFSCSQCDKAYNFKYRLDHHVKSVHQNERPYECEVCKKTFTSNDNLKVHLRVHSGEHPYQCSVCDKTFTQLSNKYRHELVHKDVKPFTCSMCHKAFYTKYEVKKHMSVHDAPDGKPFKCTECDKSFVKAFSLRNHIQRIHLGIRHTCTICQKSFKIPSSLKEHMKKHINCAALCIIGSQDSINCETSMKKNEQENIVNKTAEHELHSREQNNSIESQEETCGSAEQQNVISTMPHLVNSAGNTLEINCPKDDNKDDKTSRPYSCNQCSQSFRRGQDLKRHADRVHINPKYFRYCDKAFKQCNNRQRHEQTHVPEKRFKCETCNHYFSSCSELKEHILIHEVSDGKPFKCHICPRGFARKKSLKSHINVVHVNPKHCCNICGERFHTTREAKKHAKIHPVEGGGLEVVVEEVQEDNVHNVSVLEGGVGEGADENGGGETVEQRKDDVMIVDGGVEASAGRQGSGTGLTIKRGRGRPKKKVRGATGNKGGHEVREMVTTENHDTQINNSNEKSKKEVSNERENNAGSQDEDCSQVRRNDCKIQHENGILDLRNDLRNTTNDIEDEISVTSQRNNETNSNETILKILEGKPFVCPVCDKGYASKNGLKHHHDKTHKNKSVLKDNHIYYCPECKEGFKSKRRFWLHDVKVHGLLNTSESENETISEEDGRGIRARIIRNAKGDSSTPTDTVLESPQ